MDERAQALAEQILFLQHRVMVLQTELVEQAEHYQRIIAEGQDFVRDLQKQLQYQREHITHLERDLRCALSLWHRLRAWCARQRRG